MENVLILNILNKGNFMKLHSIILAVTFAVISTNMYAADQNPLPIDYSDVLKNCKIVEEAFFLTVYRKPDGTHIAILFDGSRDEKSEIAFDTMYPVKKESSYDEPGNPA